MDFSFSEDQTTIADLARQILNDRVDDQYHKSHADDIEFVDRKLWNTLAQSGLIGLSVSERYGGSSMGFIELCLLLEEQGKTLAPIPLLPSLVQAALPIEKFGTDEQKNRFLPSLVAGDTHLSAALYESTRGELATMVTASEVEGGWRLSGQTHNVPYAKMAAGMLLPAKDKQGRVLMFVVDCQHHKPNLLLQKSTNKEPQYLWDINGLLLTKSDLLGDIDDGNLILDWILQRSYTASAGLMLGVLKEALTRTAAYTLERQQFGRAIASFQAVSHRAANGYIDVEALRSTYWEAMWRLHEGHEASCEALSAKWWACEAGHRVAHTGQHLHGGIGSDMDFPIHRFFLWAKQIEFTLGAGQQQLAHTGRLLASGNSVGEFINLSVSGF